VDYERQNFTISQTVFSENMTSKIIPILPVTQVSTTKGHAGLDHSGLVGVIVACVFIAILLVAGSAFLFYKRKQRKRNSAAVETALSPSGLEAHEVLGSKLLIHQLDSSCVREMDAGFTHEIGGTTVTPELAAEPVTPRNQWAK